jgi:hypothetical protein
MGDLKGRHPFKAESLCEAANEQQKAGPRSPLRRGRAVRAASR